jgi:hypothetical protein
VAFASIDPSDRRRELNNNALGFEEVNWRIIIFKIRIVAVIFLDNSRATVLLFPAGEANLSLSVLEFLNNLWGLGTE